MDIAIIDGCTRVLGESQGYLGLPLRDVSLNDSVNGPGTPAMETAWTASPLELEMLNAGAPIILCVLGKQHPPVMLSVGTPAHPLYPRTDAEGVAERIFDLMPFEGPTGVERPVWVAGAETDRQNEARRYAQAALNVQRQGELTRTPSPQADVRVDVDRLAARIVTAACELDGPADPASDDTISITMKDLEAVVHRHVTAALEAYNGR